jgi:hypothetical protein
MIVVEVGATIDYSDEAAITDFITTYLRDETEVDPINAPGVTMQQLLQGGEMHWTAAGIITLRLLDETDQKQPVMQQFLLLAMISGRFRVEEETQRHIFANAATGDLYPTAKIPTAWWDALDGKPPWNAPPMLPPSGGVWIPEKFLEWVDLVT